MPCWWIPDWWRKALAPTIALFGCTDIPVSCETSRLGGGVWGGVALGGGGELGGEGVGADDRLVRLYGHTGELRDQPAGAVDLRRVDVGGEVEEVADPPH